MFCYCHYCKYSYPVRAGTIFAAIQLQDGVHLLETSFPEVEKNCLNFVVSIAQN